MIAAPAVLLAALAAVPAAPAVVCYVETLYGGATADALDLGACTHVVEAFLLVEPSGALRPANGLPRRDLVRAARRAGARALVAVGGATVPGAAFGAVARDGAALRRFTDGVVRAVLDGGYDGVDLDWEFPAPWERADHARLVAAARGALAAAFRAGAAGRSPLLLVGVTPGAHLEGYDFARLAPEVDLFVQFGYDFRNPALGPWAHTARLWPDGASAPIEASVRGTAGELVRRGVPRQKLVVALPLYASDGRPWVDVRARALAAGAALHPLFLESEVDGAWVTGPAAIAAKARRILGGAEIAGGAAGGVALWQLGHQGTHPDLTRALRAALPSAAAASAAARP